MKRCPQCNRFETDEALKFCRVDGATLVVDSSSLDPEAGTAQLGSARDASEVHTSILPHQTQDNVNRVTGPTTALPAQPASSTTSDLPKPQSRRTAIVIAVIVTAVVAAVTAIVVDSYRSRIQRKINPIDRGASFREQEQRCGYRLPVRRFGGLAHLSPVATAWLEG
jgi:hypothetical protein